MLRQVLRPVNEEPEIGGTTKRHRIAIVVRDIVYAMTHQSTWPVDARDVWRVEPDSDDPTGPVAR